MGRTNAERCREYREKLRRGEAFTPKQRMDMYGRRLKEVEDRLEKLEQQLKADPFRI